MDIPNPILPERMTPNERIGEICEILAQGLIRLFARQSSRLSADQGESCLHFPPDQCRHGPNEINSEEAIP